ncbi:hypothetical protein [Paracnuella aquatica]|uniref:hypothetical protein n=1 Tax=Paracnuella aquatica TaxID=2268757 RepID=UPI000DEF1975|nr:hypothetical protein [Paracnuella aquatica]RPD51229.1 hypothetical protein DRJ53_00675 [Paracnuella aquatica]
MLKHAPLLLLTLLLFVVPKAQELGGIWKGTMTQAPGGCFPEYHLELQIKIVGEKVTGVCYHYSDTRNYVKKAFEGVYHPRTKSITVHEQAILAFHIPEDCTPCVKTYDLWYAPNNGETLSGDWTGRVLNTGAACQPGHITLSRQVESAFEGIQEIGVDTGNIRLDFYDNGEIDDDSISVLVNNKTVLSHEKLGLKPLTLNIRMEPTKEIQEVVMKAENLGSIPPNTALLIVTTSFARYKLFLKSTTQRSASVRFFYEPEKPKTF